MTDKEIEKWLADDEERIRKYIEKKELERKAKKEEDRWGAWYSFLFDWFVFYH